MNYGRMGAELNILMSQNYHSPLLEFSIGFVLYFFFTLTVTCYVPPLLTDMLLPNFYFLNPQPSVSISFMYVLSRAA